VNYGYNTRGRQTGVRRRSRATREFIVFSACLAFFLFYLAVERLRLARALRRVPLRIAVTGTRGKSGVTRLIAAGLRESGARVMAKTTGSKAALILPDGSEEGIERPGPPSIREQIRVVERAAAAGAGSLVIELMSVGRECLEAESRRIVRPGLLALTNVRLDHLEAMGRTKEDIARTLAASIPGAAKVFLPAEESHRVFGETASRLGARLVLLDELRAEAEGPAGGDFEPNLRLALAVLESLGVSRTTAVRGMAKAGPDFGSLRVWRASFGTPSRAAWCVSAFAANDPESSAAVLARLPVLLPAGWGPLVGLLALREDRGDRTLQWVRAAGEGFFNDFEHVAVLGGPARAAARMFRRALGPGIRRFSFVPDSRPAELMERLVRTAGPGPVLVGLGNICGPGEAVIRHWQDVGTPHGR
jgi:gamma-polyglutamate synthase